MAKKKFNPNKDVNRRGTTHKDSSPVMMQGENPDVTDENVEALSDSDSQEPAADNKGKKKENKDKKESGGGLLKRILAFFSKKKNVASEASEPATADDASEMEEVKMEDEASDSQSIVDIEDLRDQIITLQSGISDIDAEDKEKIMTMTAPELFKLLIDDVNTHYVNFKAYEKKYEDAKNKLEQSDKSDQSDESGESDPSEKSDQPDQSQADSELEEKKEELLKITAERDSLKNTVSDLEKEQSKLKNDIKSKDIQIESLQDQLRSGLTRIDELHAEIDGLKSDKDTLNKQIAHNENIIAEKNNRIGKLESELAHVKSELEKCNVELEEIRKSDAGELKAKLDEAEKREKTLNEEKEAKIKEIEALTTEKDNLNGQIDSLNENITGLKAESAKKDETIKDKNSEIEVLHKSEQALKKAEKIHIEDKEKLNKEIDAAKQELTKKDTVISAKNDEIKGHEDKISSLTENVKSLSIDNDSLSTDLENAENLIEKLNRRNAENEAETAKAKSDLVATIGESKKKAVDAAKAVYAILEEGGYESGGAEISESCEEDETVNRKRFANILSKIEEINLDAMASAADFDRVLSEVLLGDIEKGMDGIMLPLARLCGYSRMPFMREERGDADMTLDRSKTSRIESALTALLSLVGIELIIPVPFCDRLEEGDFEDATGNVPNLDYICPNSRAHLDGVDRADRAGLVTDIITVGYRKDGHTTKAKVLI